MNKHQPKHAIYAEVGKNWLDGSAGEMSTYYHRLEWTKHESCSHENSLCQVCETGSVIYPGSRNFQRVGEFEEKKGILGEQFGKIASLFTK